MKRTVALFACLCAIAAGASAAGNPEALTFDHMHLAFPDTKASTAWYIKYLGATARPDGAEGVFFGPIRFNMRKADNLAPSSGSVVDAVGLSYTDLDGRLKVLEGSGARVLQAPKTVTGIGRMAVIEDPWGTKIELVQDPKLLGFHHARVLASEPVAMKKWFAEALGGEHAKMGNADALTFGGIWLIIDKAATPPRASEGTTIDHLGFRTKDIKTELADLASKGVKATGAPRQDPNVPTTFATFIDGATGRIEITQR